MGVQIKNKDTMHDLKSMYNKTLAFAIKMFEDDVNEFGNFRFTPRAPKMNDLQVIALSSN